MAWVLNPDGELVNLGHVPLVRIESGEGGEAQLVAYGVPGKVLEGVILARGLTSAEATRGLSLIAQREHDKGLFHFPEDLEQGPQSGGPRISMGPEPEDTPTGQ